MLKNNPEKPNTYYGLLTLHAESSTEACVWALEEDRAAPKEKPYDILHIVDAGDTLIVGMPKEYFDNLDAQDILHFKQFNDRIKPLPAFKQWQAIYPNIVFDYMINRVDLKDDKALQEIPVKLEGTAQRIDGSTVDGFAKGVAPQIWYDIFKNGTPAVLIKATPA